MADAPNGIIEHFPVGALGCMCTIIGDRATGEAVVVDGGAEIERIMARVTALNLRIVQLLYTHAHIDHIGESAALREQSHAPTGIHPADLPLAQTLPQQARLLGVPAGAPAIFDHDILDGDELKVGAFHVVAHHTPGHTPGSTSFAVTVNGTTRLLTGDTLFAGAVGRWDLGGTSLADIVMSIRKKLLPFPDATVIVPGHGSLSSIGTERRHNPFLQG